ncbi:MAG: glycogen-binding domain-containing protein [Gemmatimonadota bacterium]
MRGRARDAIVIIVAVTAAPIRPLEAQRTAASVDLSGVSVWYSDSILSSGASISPTLRFDWSRATVGASADISRLGRGGVSAQAQLSPSLFTPSYGAVTGELAGAFGGSTHEDGTRTGQALAIARLYAMRATSGAWIGGGAGRTTDGSLWLRVRQAELGAWFERSGVTTLATITPVAVADTLRYTDFQAALHYPVRAYELGASLGTRSGTVGPAVGGTSRVWGSVNVVSWLSDRIAVVMNAGAYPVDLTQGYPGGRFATVAMRLGVRPVRGGGAMTGDISDASITGASDAEARREGVTAFDVATADRTQRILRVRAPDARTVEIAGDFTHWRPLQLTRGGDGWWSVTLTIGAGTHEMNVRVNGGKWVAPPGLVTTRDEFGGISGILTFE